jgi:hypothetical protein
LDYSNVIKLKCPTKNHLSRHCSSIFQYLFLGETDRTFCDFSIEWLPIYSDSKDVKPGLYEFAYMKSENY